MTAAGSAYSIVAPTINGTLSTVTALTNLPAITTGWLTADGIAASALNSKGNWSTHSANDVLTAFGTGTTLSSLAPASTALSTETWSGTKAGYLDAAISSRHASGAAVAKSPATLDWAADVTNPPTIGTSTLDAAGVRTAVGLASANLDTQLDALPTAAENATAVGTRTTDGVTYDAALRAVMAVLFGEATVDGTTVTFKRQDGSTTAVTVQLGATRGERTSSTINP